jgi:hypothetical protein
VLSDILVGRKRPCSASKPGSSKKYQVTKATFEKWQQEHEREHQTLSWLRCKLDMDVASLYCDVCRKYEGNLESLKNFSRVWISGSTNQKVSNVLDHATSEVHKAAMVRLRADSVKASGGRSVVLTSAIADRPLHVNLGS